MESIKTLWLTPRGASELQHEKSRQQQFLRKITEQIHENAIPKDAEDFAHDIAMQQQAQNRLRKLEYVLSRAKIASDSHGSTVDIGSTLCLDDGIKTHTITIVGSEEADPVKGAISAESPLGKAVFGKIAGERVLFDSPAGHRELVIMLVE